MPGQLLTLRLLNSSASTSFSHINLTNSFPSSRYVHGISLFSKALPYKLKHFGLCLENAATGFTVRRFSSRLVRSGSSSGRNHGLSGGRRPAERRTEREFQPERFGGRVGQSKSLIEDEAELSDWIGDLKTDSLKLSESDSDGVSFSNSRNRTSGRGRFSSKRESDSDDSAFRGGRNSRGGGNSRGSVSGSFSRNRKDRDSDDFGSRGNSRGSLTGSLSRNRRDSDSDDSGGRRNSRGSLSGSFSRNQRDSNSADFPSGRNSRGSLSGSFSRNQRDSNSADFASRRNSRGSLSGSFSRNQRDSNSADFASMRNSRGSFTGSFSRNRFGADSDGMRPGSAPKSRYDSYSEEDLPLRGRGQGLRGGFNPGTNNTDSSLKFEKGGRDGGNLQRRGMGTGRQAMQVLEDEEQDEEEDEDEDEDDSEGTISGFGDDLLSESEGDDVFEDIKSLPELTKEGCAPPKSSAGKPDSYLSETRFDQCSISPLSLKGIKAAGYERMTVVQEATLSVILKGKDVLAKARTGTGKTVAFLLPAIEAIVKSPPVDRDQKRPPINVLVICPTRELASQAAAEANTLLKFHPSIGVQVVIGGTRLTLEQKRMQANPCQILVATPGRLKDHIENTPGFATRLLGVKVLVLDEADHLLDMGFRKDIERIIAAVPKQRQTLLFSATVPEEVRQICHVALKRDHEFINAVEEGGEETHSQVRQMHLVAPLDKHFSILYSILAEHISEDSDYKVLVFCTTAMVTRLVAELLSELNLNVREIHSRKPQSYRTRVSDEFRKSKGLILVTSDVSARGVDYPDVTLVVQVGLPSDREQYIHRLGRTGRKGKEGKGILLLAPWEEFFLSSVKDLPLTMATLPAIDPDTKKKVERALSHVEMKNKEAAYQAWLGYYNSNKNVGREKVRLVELANEFSKCMGLDTPPAIPKLVLGKMGLKNVPGLRAK